jgi:hypothetical protein
LIPVLEGVDFSHGWSGLFGLTRDLLPIAGRIPIVRADDGSKLHAALCAGSMIWSVLAGQTAAQTAIEGNAPLSRFFAPRRAYTPLDPLTAKLGKSIAFPVSHLYAGSLLTGHPEQVARQQRRVRNGSWLLGAGAAAVLAKSWHSRRTGGRR